MRARCQENSSLWWCIGMRVLGYIFIRALRFHCTLLWEQYIKGCFLWGHFFMGALRYEGPSFWVFTSHTLLWWNTLRWWKTLRYDGSTSLWVFISLWGQFDARMRAFRCEASYHYEGPSLREKLEIVILLSSASGCNKVCKWGPLNNK